MAVFTGPWANIACEAFSTAVSDHAQTAQLAERAYKAAIDSVAAEWARVEAMCSDEMDMFGQRAAGGACLFLADSEIHCFWLGGTPVCQLRDGKLFRQNTPHTVYYALAAHGKRPTDDQFYRVQCRSFVYEPQIDSEVWDAAPGDRIFILPYTVKPSSLSLIATTEYRSARSFAEAVTETLSRDCQPMATTVVMSELCCN